MNGELIPKNTRELYFYVKGEFDGIRQEIRGIKKITFWIGGITGGVIGAIVILVFKFFFGG